ISNDKSIDGVKDSIKLEDNVKINNFYNYSVSNGADAKYERNNSNVIEMGLSLPNKDSFLVYKTEVIVLQDTSYAISDISGLPDNLEYEINNYDIGSKICDDKDSNKCNWGALKEFEITIRYKDLGYKEDNINYDINLNVSFNTFYNIKYEDMLSTGLPLEGIKGRNLVIDFKDDVPEALEIVQNDVILINPDNYTYIDGKLVIFEVDNDIIIKKVVLPKDEDNKGDNKEEIIDKPNNEIPKKEISVEDMTLEEKIGQMIIVSASGKGTSLNNNFKKEISSVKPGGIIVFGDNIASYSQLTKYMNDINSLSDIPLIWSIDQEGGRVQRISKLSDMSVTKIPAMYELGKTNDSALAYDVGRVIGEELGVFGFNMDFAPDLDIWSNASNTVIGNRSFGTNADVVTKMGIAVANGLSSTGVIPVYKHFPGHGDTAGGDAGDSHFLLPKITKSIEELENNELKPFENAINNGAKVIMVSHLDVPALTEQEGIPASLSNKLINGYLKDKMGFNGIVITDSLAMKGITNYYTPQEYLVMAINAGVDILLAPDNPTNAVQIIKQAVLDGRIDETLINKSVTKILKLKKEMNKKRYDKSYLGSNEHKNIINRIK
ncbi:MAG TPA: hypothetical protein DCE23_02910, partial [Firmicutes bacterium]|nr:hypothetical protein [Bacillota bacterium]